MVRVWAPIPSQCSQMNNHCPFLMLTLPASARNPISLFFFFLSLPSKQLTVLNSDTSRTEIDVYITYTYMHTFTFLLSLTQNMTMPTWSFSIFNSHTFFYYFFILSPLLLYVSFSSYFSYYLYFL